MPANGRQGQDTESRADEGPPAFWAQLGLSPPPGSPGPSPAAGLAALQSARFGPLGASGLPASRPHGLHRRMAVASEMVVGGWRLPYLPHLRAQATSQAVGAHLGSCKGGGGDVPRPVPGLGSDEVWEALPGLLGELQGLNMDALVQLLGRRVGSGTLVIHGAELDVAYRHWRSRAQSALQRLVPAVGSIDEYAVVDQLELAGREHDRVQREVVGGSGSGQGARDGAGGTRAVCEGEERERARRQLDAAAERVSLLMLTHLRLQRALQQEELVAAAATTPGQGQVQEQGEEAGAHGAGGGAPGRLLCALRSQHRHRAAACVCCDALLRHLRLPVLLLPELDLVAGMAAEAQDYLGGRWPIGRDPSSCSCTPADKARALARALAGLCGCGGSCSSCKAAAAGAGAGQRSGNAVAGDGGGASSGQDASGGKESTAESFCACWFYSLRFMHSLVASLARGAEWMPGPIGLPAETPLVPRAPERSGPILLRDPLELLHLFRSVHLRAAHDAERAVPQLVAVAQQRRAGDAGGGATRHPRAKATHVEGCEERQEDQRLRSELMTKYYFLRVKQVVDEFAGEESGGAAAGGPAGGDDEGEPPLDLARARAAVRSQRAQVVGDRCRRVALWGLQQQAQQQQQQGQGDCGRQCVGEGAKGSAGSGGWMARAQPAARVREALLLRSSVFEREVASPPQQRQGHDDGGGRGVAAGDVGDAEEAARGRWDPDDRASRLALAQAWVDAEVDGAPRAVRLEGPLAAHMLLQLGAGWAAAWSMTSMLVDAAGAAAAAGGAGAGAARDGGPGQGAGVAGEGLGHPGCGVVLQLGCYTEGAAAKGGPDQASTSEASPAVGGGDWMDVVLRPGCPGLHTELLPYLQDSVPCHTLKDLKSGRLRYNLAASLKQHQAALVRCCGPEEAWTVLRVLCGLRDWLLMAGFGLVVLAVDADKQGGTGGDLTVANKLVDLDKLQQAMPADGKASSGAGGGGQQGGSGPGGLGVPGDVLLPHWRQRWQLAANASTCALLGVLRFSRHLVDPLGGGEDEEDEQQQQQEEDAAGGSGASGGSRGVAPEGKQEAVRPLFGPRARSAAWSAMWAAHGSVPDAQWKLEPREEVEGQRQRAGYSGAEYKSCDEAILGACVECDVLERGPRDRRPLTLVALAQGLTGEHRQGGRAAGGKGKGKGKRKGKAEVAVGRGAEVMEGESHWGPLVLPALEVLLAKRDLAHMALGL